MAWALLLVAGLCEVGWAVGLKYTDGFTKPVPTTLVIVAMVASVWMLAIALRTIPVGTGYAVWTGVAPWAQRSSAWRSSTSRARWPASCASASSSPASWG